MVVHSIRFVALLLLGLMLAASAPRGLWHECGHDHAVDVGPQGAAVSAGTHCPLCETAGAPFVPALQPPVGMAAAAPLPMVVPPSCAALGCYEQVPPGRGPPMMAA